MKASTSPSPKGKSPSQQIDAIIKEPGDWRSKILSQLRALIKKADPAVVEEVKWKKPSNPMGVPVWSHDGIICIGEDAQERREADIPQRCSDEGSEEALQRESESNTVRAIDFREGDTVDEAALKALILEAVELNMSKLRER